MKISLQSSGTVCVVFLFVSLCDVLCEERERETERQTDRQTDRETDRQTERQVAPRYGELFKRQTVPTD